MKLTTLIAGVLTTFACFSAPAGATTMVELSVDQMVFASESIVRGTITDIWTEMDDHGIVWTRAQLEVSETLKGDAVPGLVVSQPGGEWGGFVTRVDGSARFSLGEDGVFFVESLGGGEHGLVGMLQGKYTVRMDPYARELIVQRFHVSKGSYDHRFIPLPPEGERIQLDDFEAGIRQIMERGWDGQPVPGVSDTKLRTINRVQAEVK